MTFLRNQRNATMIAVYQLQIEMGISTIENLDDGRREDIATEEDFTRNEITCPFIRVRWRWLRIRFRAWPNAGLVCLVFSFYAHYSSRIFLFGCTLCCTWFTEVDIFIHLFILFYIFFSFEFYPRTGPVATTNTFTRILSASYNHVI